MRRRDFIKVVGGSAVTWPLAARAQQSAMAVIGLLQLGTPTSYDLSGIREGLKDAGYIEGQNLTIEYRFANDDDARLPELAADLVRHKVRVIATVGSGLAAQAAKKATNAIPVVFGHGVDPVKQGIVASLNRPGANVTGVISLANELYGKQLGILHELMPSALHFGVLYNPRSPLRAVIAEDTGSAASALGLSVELLDASTGADIDAVFARIGDERHVQGLLVSLDLAFLHWHKQTIWRMWPTAVLNDPFTLDILETERKSWSGIRKSLRAAAKDQRTLQGMANAQSAKLLARVVRLEKKIAAASDMEAIKLIEDKISALLRVLNEHVLPLVQVLTQGPNAEQAFDRAHAPESMEKIVRLEAALDARIGKVLARLVGLKEFKRTPAAGAAAIELNQHSELLTDRR